MPTPSGIAKESTLARRFGGAKLAYSAAVSAAGATTLITPPAGQRVAVVWVYAMPDPNQSAIPDITISVGAVDIYRGYALAHWERFVGGVDDIVTVTLDIAIKTLVTVHYELLP
jgi:hypothetical protein